MQEHFLEDNREQIGGKLVERELHGPHVAQQQQRVRKPPVVCTPGSTRVKVDGGVAGTADDIAPTAEDAEASLRLLLPLKEHHDTPRPSLSGRLFTCHVNPSPSYMSSPPLQTGVISRRHCAVTCCTPFGPSGVKRVYILSFFHPGRKEQPRTGALRWRCIIVRVSADHDDPNDPIRPDAC